ncbi:MAG: hypothetical protein NTX47_03375 [Candidatus Omnitrophica bacterium]|nr:hypothetical protein [Candidatus Omnitrophota bacterium]
MMQKIALIASIILPLWNIPLIVRIIKRRSSKDLSLYWAIGVWVCFLAMFPLGVKSPDIVYRTFTYVNFFFFSIVAFCTVFFHNRPIIKEK